MTKRYVKSDIVDLPYFTKDKPYEVVAHDEDIGVTSIDDDDGLPRGIVAVGGIFNIKCAHLDDKDTWKWCDENGKEL